MNKIIFIKGIIPLIFGLVIIFSNKEKVKISSYLDKKVGFVYLLFGFIFIIFSFTIKGKGIINILNQLNNFIFVIIMGYTIKILRDKNNNFGNKQEESEENIEEKSIERVIADFLQTNMIQKLIIMFIVIFVFFILVDVIGSI